MSKTIGRRAWSGKAMPNAFLIGVLLLAGLPTLAGQTLAVGDVAALQGEKLSTVHFTVITARGYVGFSVPKDWPVLAMQSKPPVSVAAFVAPNPADKGTSDSTNIAISLIEPETEKGKIALGRVGKSLEGDVAASSHSGWECFAQSAHQKKTTYTILDAKKAVADVVVTVRVAWPHLQKNSPTYDAEMKSVFDSLLDGIDGNLGAYAVTRGEVVRRPDK